MITKKIVKNALSSLNDDLSPAKQPVVKQVTIGSLTVMPFTLSLNSSFI